MSASFACTVVAMLMSCSWSSLAPLKTAPTSLPDGTSVFYSTTNFEQTAGPRTGVKTHTTTWTLQLHNEAATLTMSSGTPAIPLVLEGTIEASNAGVPRMFHQLDGPRHADFREYPVDIHVTCAIAEVPVHRRAAVVRYRCDDSTVNDGGWPDDPQPMRAIRCTLGKEFDGEGRLIVFAKSPVEQIDLVCARHDVVDRLDAGYRVAGTLQEGAH